MGKFNPDDVDPKSKLGKLLASTRDAEQDSARRALSDSETGRRLSDNMTADQRRREQEQRSR